MTDEERLVLTETRRVWIQTARSRNPSEKTSEPQYEQYFNCPACKHHGNHQNLCNCPGDCVLSPVWGSTEEGACEHSQISPYAEWRVHNIRKINYFFRSVKSSRQTRSAAWKLVNGIETMLWNDRLTNV